MTRAAPGTFAPRPARTEANDTPVVPVSPRQLSAAMLGVLTLTLLGGLFAQLL